MKIRVFLFICVVLCYSALTASAQYSGGQGGRPNGGNGTLKGMVVDSKTNQPIEYANITITRAKDSSLVSGGVTDNKGNFQVENLPYGKFVVKVKFIGYNQKKIPGILLTPQKTDVDLGKIDLESSDANLKEVTITAQKDMVSYNIDRKVFNVDRNIAAAGGTALDLMQNIPSVSVDVNGSVSLRGSENVTILVDGRPSGLTSLDQLPASMIENIEIITNPSAKFDPDGMSGIINITMKRKNAKGYNGQITLGAGTSNRYNAGINLNFRREKYNFMINYDFRRFGNKGDINTQNFNAEKQDTLSTSIDTYDRKGYFHNIKLGADWYINKKNTFSASALLNKRNMSMSDSTENIFYSPANLKRLVSSSPNDNSGYEFTATYKKTFDKKNEELTVDGFASISDGTSDQTSLQQNLKINPTPIGQPINTYTSTKNNTGTYTLQSDYVYPLDEGKLEAGVKGTFKTTDIDYANMNFNYPVNAYGSPTALSNQFTYDEQYYAAYASLGKGIAQFKYQLGLRLEQTETQAKSIQLAHETTSNKHRLDYFPTIHLQYQFSESNTLQLNYSKRINRPRSSFLNPALNNSDSLNMSKGNLDLNPEYAHSFELGHSITLGGTSLTSTAFFRKTVDVMTRYLQTSNTNSKTFTYQNLNSLKAYGVEFVLNQELTKWWKLSANYSYFVSAIEGANISGQNESDSWTAKGTTNINLPLGIDFQLNYNYRSDVVSAGSGGGRGWDQGGMGKTYGNQWFDAGLKKDFLKNKLSLTVRMSDIFKTQKFKSDAYSNTFFSHTDRTMITRVLFVGLTYKLNDFKRQRERQREESDDNQGM